MIGRRVKSSLRTRQIVKARHLQAEWMIEKGQPVILESGFGAIQVLRKELLSTMRNGENWHVS